MSRQVNLSRIASLALALACVAGADGYGVAEELSCGSIDGIYPHLAMSNDEGECGTGAVVPWAGSLWVVTYGPHCPVGSTDKLYRITPDLRQSVWNGSVGGTPANRIIHRETNQLLIGPYVIDAKGDVRVVPSAKMPGRLTGAARHLVDPAKKVYVATMETGLYELDMSTLAVGTLIREDGKNDHVIAEYIAKNGGVWPQGWDAAPVTRVPGYHGKGLCSGFGRVFVANNGENSPEARRCPFVPSGVLADWSEPGSDWRTIRRCQFTEITTADGIYGNEHPESNPIWSLGWDAKSVILAVTTNGSSWAYYRLPKASHCYDGAHGWNTEWPRIREAGLDGDNLLATMHGTFWRFPKGFSPASPNGIRPLSTYLKVIGDFCYWKDAPNGGSIVFGCDDHARSEFLGKRSLKADQPKIARSTSNLWFVKPEELNGFGPPTGEGWVWRNEDVKSGDISDPYLWEGYHEREFSFLDAEGNPVAHELVRDGDWVRVKAMVDARGANAHFVYGPPKPPTLPTLDAKLPYIDVTDDNGKIYRFPNVNGDTNVICREVATERDLLYVGGVFYELPAENAGGFAELRPIALSDEPIRSIAVDRGLVVINGKPCALDSLWKNGTASQAYWLWRQTLAPLRLNCAVAVSGCSGLCDVDLSAYPRGPDECGDSARIRRAVSAAGHGGVVFFPKGDYAIDTMLDVSNRCSLLLHKSARLKAVKEMPFVLRYFGREMEDGGHEGAAVDHNLFLKGGEFDGNGLASCVQVMGLRHFTMADTTFRNGRKVGLQLGDPDLPTEIQGGYEIFANNLYFICNLPGLAGNVGFQTYIGDSHFTDMVVVDYTVGIRDMKWSNRFTRCHVWGGPVKKTGTDQSEYLPGSISFDLRGGDAVLEDCYADTAMIGYNVCHDTRVFNCGYYNNWRRFKMDNPTVFNHVSGALIVTGGRFSKNSPHATVYRRGEKAGPLTWKFNRLVNFSEEEMQDLNDELKRSDQDEKAVMDDTKLSI